MTPNLSKTWPQQSFHDYVNHKRQVKRRSRFSEILVPVLWSSPISSVSNIKIANPLFCRRARFLDAWLSRDRGAGIVALDTRAQLRLFQRR